MYFYFPACVLPISRYVMLLSLSLGVFACRCGEDILYLVVSRLSACGDYGSSKRSEGSRSILWLVLWRSVLWRYGKRHCLCVRFARVSMPVKRSSPTNHCTKRRWRTSRARTCARERDAFAVRRNRITLTGDQRVDGSSSSRYIIILPWDKVIWNKVALLFCERETDIKKFVRRIHLQLNVGEN